MELAFFAEMAWKSALISGAALALASLLRTRAASDRALVLRLGVAMLLLLPLIALWLPALEIVAFAAPEAPPPMLYVPGPEVQLASVAGALPPAAAPTIWDDPTPLVLLAYLGGLAMVGARLLAGLWMLGRWTRSARAVTCPEWLAAFDRARAAAPSPDAIRLLAADGVTSPLSWGWRRPVILIDPDTLDQPEDADGILAHEVAHIARRDWPVLMLSRIAATLFWFNPLVWLLEREVVQQAEEAADCEATTCVEPTRYARTLLSWAQANGGLIPANSIAPSTSALGRRVRAILDRGNRERPSGSALTAAAMLLCIGIATPVAAMKLVAATAQPALAPAAASAEPPVAPAALSAPAAPAAPEAPAVPDAPASLAEIRIVAPAVRTALATVIPQIPQIIAQATAAVDPVEIEEALAEAEEGLREAGRLNHQEIAAAMREARHATRAAQIQARAAARTAGHAARAGERAQAHAARAEARAQALAAAAEARASMQNIQRTVRISMAQGADGMLRGAAGMEDGARRMQEQAACFREARCREDRIARARARGETLTHEQSIEAAEGLEEGAESMRDGAREMREAAQEMRDGGTD